MKLLKFVLLVAACAGAISAQEVQLPKVEQHTLSNGLKVLVVEYHKAPLVSIELGIPGGASLDPTGQDGLAEFTAGLLRRGTRTRSAGQIADEIDFTGGSLEAEVSRDHIGLSTQLLSKDLDKGLALFADVLLNPAFKPGEIERARVEKLAAIQQKRDEAARVAGTAFWKALFRGHPYGHQAFGTTASAKRLTRAQVQRFYEMAFVPKGAVLVIVGDVRAAETIEKVRQTFGAWKGEPAATKGSDRPKGVQGARVLIVDKPDATQAQIIIGNMGVTKSDPDYFPLLVANGALGDGFTSRLVEELRVKRSLTYNVSSAFVTARQGGAFVISTFTKTATTGEIIKAILAELKRFRESPPNEQELQKAKNYLCGNFSRNFQKPDAIAQTLLTNELLGLPPEFARDYLRRIQAVSIEEARQAFARHATEEDLLFVIVGPAEELKPQLSFLGEPEVLNLQQAVE